MKRFVRRTLYAFILSLAVGCGIGIPIGIIVALIMYCGGQNVLIGVLLVLIAVFFYVVVETLCEMWKLRKK